MVLLPPNLLEFFPTVQWISFACLRTWYKWPHVCNMHCLVEGFFHSPECFWDFIHIVVVISSLFLFILFRTPLNRYCTVYLPANGHLGCFQFSTVRNRTMKLYCRNLFVVCIFISSFFFLTVTDCVRILDDDF